jgi:iron complex transport system substrate-binding protein
VDKLSPADATAFSIRLLGQIIGHNEKANEYASFVQDRYARATRYLSAVTKRPTVLIDVQAGSLCCYTAGSGNRITQYLELAGGHSIGADAASGYDTRLNIEYVLGANPDFYFATGMPLLAAQGGMAMGGGIPFGLAKSSLEAVTKRNLLDSLTAVQEGRVFAVSHQLAISALNVLVFECFARWLHPDVTSEIDPAETLSDINGRFFAVPLEGTFWIAQ